LKIIPMNLADLEILALDCQATGANPQKGHLLEIGWIQTCAAAAVNPESLTASAYQIALPSDVDIPPAVQRITGITRTDPARAIPAAVAWHKLAQAANGAAIANQIEKCPIIIHYSRFETPFLKHLHALEHPPGTFPFRIICSHEIAKRLLPGLPRRGLRAVAGYFGHSVPRQRRSAAHAVATAVIWQHFVRQLQAQHDIQNTDQLADWLNHTRPQNRTGRDYPMKPEIRLNLPDKPGIYRMLRSNRDLLYIGKATSLKQRVNSYFRQKGARAEHTLEMLSQAAGLEVTLTGSALEAAALESDEIKQYSPPYNVALQKGQRKLTFLTRDLQRRSDKPDKLHCLGPLPKGNTTNAMAAFGAWHAGLQNITRDEVLELGHVILGVPQTYAPEPGCLAEGLDLFGHNHLTHLPHPSPLRTLTALGHCLWRERLAALAKTQTEDTQEGVEEASVDSELEVDAEPNWTPETVARRIEKFTVRSALLVRRARWLCLLSESSLAWQARDSAGGRKIVLRFENGTVAHREELPGQAEVPLPAGFAKRMADRQKIFDLKTYERLRVVTTELRRLVAAGRSVEIRLRPNATLRRRQLARMLPWV
jgi:DNA polymerase-3 subunit epsilon